ncbi:MAG: FtsX-like permease family protein, partial [Gemmatimonadetes bacterium]|nr:FtsX-like permease family protein [Gemmatimonadota bacterium]
SPAEFEDIRDQASSLTDVVAWDMGNRQIATQESSTNLFTGFWWGDGFRALRVSPQLGRGFLPEEIDQGARVAIVSHRYWANQMGSDPSVIGRVVEINADPYELVGVMPPETLLYGMDLWIPMPVGPGVFPRDRRQFQVIGRIAQNATMDQVAAELEGLARRTELEHGGEFPEYQGFRLTPATWTEANVRQFRTAALVLIGAVLAVLLIVCANVANLLLSRSNTRRREVAVRTALGASRGRVVRQLLTESLILALTGAAAGVGLAWFGVRFVDGIVAQIPFVDGNVALNMRSLAYTAAVAAAAGVAFGLAPTLHTLKADVRAILVAHGSGATGGPSRNRAQRWLVGAEVAVAVLLLFGGGLLVNSMIRLNRADPGFDHRNVLTMRLTLPWQEYSGDEIALFFETLAERVRAIPGVRDATVGSQYPPIVFAQSQIMLEGQDAVSDGSLPTSYVTQIGDEYFETLGVPLLAGRTLGPEDQSGTPPVAVINSAFRDRYMAGVDPIGERVRIGGEDGTTVEIVGVVGATANRGFSESPQPEVFGSVRQLSGTNNQFFLMIRAAGEPRSLVPQVRAAVAELDSDQPVYAIATMEEVFAGRTSTQSLATVSLAVFALFALLLSALGIYGVVAYAVAQRRREIGLRMALGASGARVRDLVVRQTLSPVVLGALIGVLGAVFLGRTLAGLLYEVEARDPLTLAAVVVVFLSVAVVASYLPARRASLADPATTLRQEA